MRIDKQQNTSPLTEAYDNEEAFFHTMDLGNIIKIYCKIIKPDIALESNLNYQIFLPELLHKKRIKVNMNARQGFYSGQYDILASLSG